MAMVEEGEAEVEREGEEGGPGLSPPSPPSPLPPGKRVLSSRSSLPSAKKTRDQPDLSHCHGCGRYVPSSAGRDRLRTLRSQWRVVLLCAGCHAGVQSAQLCSYCFGAVPAGADGFFLDCLACSRRIHLSCVPKERPFLLPCQLDPAAFNCVDCCPMLKPRARSPRTAGSGVSLEDFVRDASSAAEEKQAAAKEAKQNALHKVEVALRAAEAARKALDAVVVAEKETSEDPVVNDEELALQLHLAMNGSQRISRHLGCLGVGGSEDLKKVRGGGVEPVGGDGERNKLGVCRNVEVCTEDKSFYENTKRSWLIRNSALHLDSDRAKEQEEEIANKDGLVNVPVKEELGSCSGKANSSREVHTVDSALVYCRRPARANYVLPQDYGRDAEGKSSEKLQREKSSSCPDRYLRKYRKRYSNLEGKVDGKENQLVSCRQMSCNKESRNLTEATYNSNSVSMYSSSCAHGFPGC